MLANKRHDHLASTLERIEHLRAVPLFEEIKQNEEALKALALIMEEKVYPPDAKIITEGLSSAEMFVLIKGTASVHKSTPEGDTFRVAILDGSKHAFFGEGAMVDAELRSATIISDTECHCLVLEREAFRKYASEHPEWALPFYQRITSMVMGRLRKTNGDLLVLYKALLSEIRGT